MSTFKILLLEDNEQDALRVKRELKGLGFPFDFNHVSTRAAYNSCLQNEKPDIVISDQIMPDYDGFTALADLKKVDANTPAILLSGFMTEEMIDKACQLGYDDYLNKSNMERLTQSIKRLIYLNDKNQLHNGKEETGNADENRFRLIAEATSDVITSNDIDGVFRYVSPACKEVLGYEPEELVGTLGYDYIHPDDVETIEKVHLSLIETQTKQVFEYRFKKKDGNYVWLEATSQPAGLNKNTGEIMELVSISRDITERVHREKKLRKAQGLFSEAQQLAHLGNWDYNVLKQEIYWSSGMYGIYGLAPHTEIHPEIYVDYTHPNDIDQMKIAIEECVQTQKPTEIQHRIYRKDRMLRHLLTKVRVKTNGENQPERIYGITQDVTEYKKKEEKLLQTEQMLLEAQKLANFGNWDFDNETRKVFWSSGMRKIYDIEDDFPVDIDFFLSSIHPDDKQIVLDLLNNAPTYKEKVDHTFRIVRHNGEVRFVREIMKVVLDNEGNLQRLYGTSQDVTELKNAQIMMEKTLEEMEDRVAYRTSQLSATNKLLEEEINDRTAISQKLEEKNKDIIESITYAKRLQKAILPAPAAFKKHFKESFVFNKPRDIVSGDFYWTHRARKKTMIACCDCTGHGVPGAFMSLLGAESLNKIVIDNEWKYPSLVLELLDSEICSTLNRHDEEINDGMDMAFCMIDHVARKIFFSGAMNSIVIARANGNFEVYKGSRFALGGYIGAEDKKFETISIDYKEGDMLYMFSDGFQDQFGGEKDKKLRFSGFQGLLKKASKMRADKQKGFLEQAFNEWKGKAMQIDDVLVLGFRLQ